MADNYVFTGAVDDLWRDPLDWSDTTLGAMPAPAAPGPADAATLPDKGKNATIIGGPGAAASLSVLGQYALTGANAFGNISVGVGGGTQATLDLQAGSTATTTGVTLTNGTLQVSGAGAALTVNGVASIGTSSGLFALDGGAVRLGGLTLSSTGGLDSRGVGVQIDSTSSVEVGTAGNAAAGVLTVDAGNLVSGQGNITTNIVNKGTIEATAGLSASGLSLGYAIDTPSGIYTKTATVSGGGTLQIDAGATLVLSADTDNAIHFAGPTGNLLIDNAQPAHITGVISGFGPGNVIEDGFSLAGYFLTPVFQQTSPGFGTLTVSTGSTVVTTLTLAGDYTGATFVTTGVIGNAIDVITSLAIAAPVTAGSATIANPGTLFQRIGGTGNAGSLTVTGLEALLGQFTTGTLKVGAPGDAQETDQLVVTAGASLTANAVALVGGGSLSAIGAGAQIHISGALTSTSAGYERLVAAGGAQVQVGSVSGHPQFEVDALSSIEIGTLGNAALGKLTIDPGSTASVDNSLLTEVVNNGTIVNSALFNAFSAPPNINGTGTIIVAAGGSTGVNNTTNAIKFAGANSTLYLGGTVFNPKVTGVITGFGPSETISTLDLITRATYAATGPNLGVLTLYDDQAVVNTLTLAGDYSGFTFVTSGFDGAKINVVATPPTNIPVPSPGSGGHTYTYKSATSGDWDNPTNWTDNTTGLTALLSPGAQDSATIGSNTAFRLISGSGNAAALNVTGPTALSGALALGTLATSGGLVVQPGAGLTANSASITAGELHITGAGSSAVIAGALNVAGAPNLSAVDGGTLRAGSVLFAANSTSAFHVDDHSIIEIGSAANASAGGLTVDAGATLSGTTSVFAHTVDLGTIAATGGAGKTLYLEDVAGNGLLEIGAGSTLRVLSATPAIHFDDPTGTLIIDYTRFDYGNFTTATVGGLSVTGTISGFTIGDTIKVFGSDHAGPDRYFPAIVPSGGSPFITSVAYKQTAPGLGQLVIGQDGGTLGTLTLAGDYSGKTFLLDQSEEQGVITLANTPAQGQLSGSMQLSVATEGVALPGSTVVARFSDTNVVEAASAFSATIAWGDGTTTAGTVSGSNGAFTVAGGHVYGDEGNFPLVVTVTDTLNNTRVVLNGAVATAEGDGLTPHGATFSFNAGQAFSGTVATFADSDTSNNAGDFSATIDWGDGTTSSGTLIDNAGAISVTGTHTYTASVNETVRVALSDDAPGTATATAVSTAIVSGTAQGDVHFVTFSGVHFDFQGIGTFKLASSSDPSSAFDVEIQTSAFPDIPGTSVITAVTAHIGGNDVGFALDGTVTVNGSADLALNAPGTTEQLDGGTLTELSSTTYEITWASGEQLAVNNAGSYFSVAMSLAEHDSTASVGGLLGDQTINGTSGDDSFTASVGSQRFAGGLGHDSITFNFKLTDAAISFVGNQVIVDSATSHTVLTGFETYRFTDGTVNENLAIPLVDNLFYYSRYHDVWAAHLDPSQHYDQFGWHEGRDPNAFFNTTFYEALNQDVKTAGINPLTQFDQSGWKEGRQPSAAFDDAAYLAANPDVAAAKTDPLAHFLQSGAQEGRQPTALTHLIATNSFDSLYYLQHNPDVQAAEIDPHQHYDQFGWREGRNPNELFDTNDYLEAYPDVKAAGVNPLDHYDQNGWHEGREPSVNFDAQAYLAAYPDIRAAGVDPLEHFLQFGLHEGRSAFAYAM